jgi:hypothetical protein
MLFSVQKKLLESIFNKSSSVLKLIPYLFKIHFNIIPYIPVADPVARSKSRVLSAGTLDRRFESRLGNRYLTLVFLCCAVLCR